MVGIVCYIILFLCMGHFHVFKNYVLYSFSVPITSNFNLISFLCLTYHTQNLTISRSKIFYVNIRKCYRSLLGKRDPYHVKFDR